MYSENAIVFTVFNYNLIAIRPDKINDDTVRAQIH